LFSPFSSFDGDWQKGQGFSALEVAGAMAKGEGWRRSNLARLVSRSPSFASSYDRAQNVPALAKCEPDKSERHQDGAGYHQPIRKLHRESGNRFSLCEFAILDSKR